LAEADEVLRARNEASSCAEIISSSVGKAIVRRALAIAESGVRGALPPLPGVTLDGDGCADAAVLASTPTSVTTCKRGKAPASCLVVMVGLVMVGLVMVGFVMVGLVIVGLVMVGFVIVVLLLAGGMLVAAAGMPRLIRFRTDRSRTMSV